MIKNKHITKKRVVILLFLLFLLFLGIVFVWFFFSQPSVGRLTDGDPSRVAMSGSGRLRDDVPSGITKEEGRVVTKCFSFLYSTQYNPRAEESENGCVVRSSLYNPKGLFTVSWKKLNEGQLFMDDTGITLRLREDEIYTPISIEDERFSEMRAFTSKQETVEVSVFANTPGGILVVSLHDFIGTREEGVEIVQNVLRSVELP